MRHALLIAACLAVLSAPAAGAERLDPGDATWNIRLVELWGREEKGRQRNLDIYPVFEDGKWARAVATARRFNTSIHFVDVADVRLDGRSVRGTLKITISPDRWVPRDGQIVRAEIGIEGELTPSADASAKHVWKLAGRYEGTVGGEKVSGEITGGVEPTQTDFDSSVWSVMLNQVVPPGAVDRPMLEMRLGLNDGKVTWGEIGPTWRDHAHRVCRLDVSRFRHAGGTVTGRAAIPARAVDVAADPGARTELAVKVVRVQGLPGGRATLTTRLDGKVVDGPIEAFGRGLTHVGPSAGADDELWRTRVDTARWWVPVEGFEPPGPGEHPRLLFRRGEVAALREKAETPVGKAIVRRLRAILGHGGEKLPTAFNTTPPHNHNKSPKLPLGVFTTWHGAGYGMLYQITGKRKYADLARRAVELAFEGKIDRDNRYAWFKPGTELRVGAVLAAIAYAYDLAYDGWPDDFRRKVAAEIQNYRKVVATGGEASIRRLCGRTGYPPGSNHYGAHFGGTGVALLAIRGDAGTNTEFIDARLAEIDRMIPQMLAQGFGDHGWYAEGHHPSRVSSQCGLVELLQVMRTAAGRDYLSPRPNARWLTLRWVAEILAEDGGKAVVPHRGTYGNDVLYGRAGGGLSHAGEIAFGLGAVGKKYAPAVLWTWRRFLKDSELAGTPWRTDDEPIYNAFVYPHRAVFALVNWPIGVEPVNPAEVMPKAFADTIHGYFVCRNRWRDGKDIVVTHLLNVGPNGYHRVKDAGTVRIRGLGIRADWRTKFRGGVVTDYRPGDDGSMTLRTRQDGKPCFLAVDLSGAAAPAVLVGTGPGFEQVALRGDKGKDGASAKASTIRAGGRTFHVLTLQNGPAPAVSADGDGIRIGGRRYGLRDGRLHIGG